MSARNQRPQRGWLCAAFYLLSTLCILGAWTLSYLDKGNVPTFAACSAFFAVLATGISPSEIITLLQLWRSRSH